MSDPFAPQLDVTPKGPASHRVRLPARDGKSLLAQTLRIKPVARAIVCEDTYGAALWEAFDVWKVPKQATAVQHALCAKAAFKIVQTLTR